MVSFMYKLLGLCSGPDHLIKVDDTSRTAGSHERRAWSVVLRCNQLRRLWQGYWDVADGETSYTKFTHLFIC